MPAEPVAVVTGAASGIGRATALVLASDGYRLVLADRDGDALAGVAAACASSGRDALPMQVDLAVAASAAAVVQRALADFGRIDVLHNNAGLMFHHDSVESVDLAQWQLTLDVMLSAAFAASRAAFAPMREQGGGLLVHTASRAAWMPLPWGVPYAAAKSGLLGMSRSLAALGRQWGIRSNAICPGPVRTGLQAGAPRSLMDRLDAEGWVSPADVAALVRHFIADPSLSGAEVLVELRDGVPSYFVSEPVAFRRIELAISTSSLGRERDVRPA